MTDTVTVNSVLHGERTFRKTGTRPYRRKDGTDTTLALWESRCIICGTPFEVATPHDIRTPQQTHSFGTVTCPKHRSSRRSKV